VVQVQPPPACGRRLVVHVQRRGHRCCQAASLPSHEAAEAAHGGEGIAADFVVVDDEAEAIFQRRDQADDGHRVELGNRAEQRCVRPETQPAATQAEDFVNDAQYFEGGVQGGVHGRNGG
jgi:hypothetical protein